MATATSLAPHRLRLSAAEYSYLVTRLELSMPPGWDPPPEHDVEPADLVKRGVLRGDGDLLAVHPSVTINLQILSAPQIMLDTTATIGALGQHCLHAVSGALGASLFELDSGGVELSLFAATDLGRELVRAVPSEVDSEILPALGTGAVAPELRGRVPLDALHELGVAKLLQGADSGATTEVLAELRLPPETARLAARITETTNGMLACLITGWVDGAARSGRVAWLHSGKGWLGLRPDSDRMVLVEPVAREDLGVWVTPFVAEALTHD
jgi:hypothetical protein